MKITVYGETQEVAVFTASYRDFVKVHSPKDWQGSFFEVMGWKNTLHSRFYELTIESTSKGEAFLRLVSPAKYSGWVHELLVNCGYEQIAMRKAQAFAFDDPVYDNDGLDDVIGYYCE